MKQSLSSKIFDYINILFMILLCFVMLYPFVYVFSASISEEAYVASGDVWLWPKGFNLEAYKTVLGNKFVWQGYKMTILYTLAQVGFTVFFLALMAYPLSKSNLVGRRLILFLITFTMLFNPGLIPNFLNIKRLGLYNTFWALIFPGVANAFYLFLLRTFFKNNVPQALEDAAVIDGASIFKVLFKIVMPLSKPVLFTVGLFVGVSQWNAFFGALVYLTDKTLYPLQLHLRNVVISGSIAASKLYGDKMDVVRIQMTIKYATIMVAIIPIICVYPFIQKYFVKGATLGSIKG